MSKFKKVFFVPIIFLLVSILFLNCKKVDNKSNIVALPNSPTELTASVISPTQINLNWIDRSTTEDGFKLERKTGNSNFTVIATIGKDVTTYNDNGLTTNTSYTYRVYSYNSSGPSSTYSNEVTISTYGLPTITTTLVSGITATEAISGGTINSDGGSPITAKGIVWSTLPNPTISLATKTAEGTGTASFASKLNGLSSSTKYYVKAYATNAAGTSYGNEINFTTGNIDITSGLVAFYPFTGNAGDSSGNNNHGIVNGATLTTDRFGIANKSYFFSGNNCNTYISANINTANITSGLTISAWVLRANNGCIGPRILDFISNEGPNKPGAHQWIWNNSNESVIISMNSTDVGNIYSLNTKPNNTWTLWVYTNDGKNERIYQDGSLITTRAVTRNPILGNNASFGRMGYPAFDAFNGKIDDIRIYNRALNQDEISFLWNDK